jgi:hypothetical protein
MERNMMVVGEVNCVNCGRTLAEAFGVAGVIPITLRPAPYQATLQVETVGGRALRCKHCHGRAFLDRELPRDVPAHGSGAFRSDNLAGAA